MLKLFPPFLTTTSIRAEFKPKKINGAFEGTYVKYKSEKDKKSSITGYPENIRTFLQSNKLSQKFDEWKKQLAMKPKLMSSTGSTERF